MRGDCGLFDSQKSVTGIPFRASEVTLLKMRPRNHIERNSDRSSIKWAAAGLMDILLGCSTKREVFNGYEAEIQSGIQI